MSAQDSQMIELNEQEMELNQPNQMPNEVHSPSNMLAPLQKSGGNNHQKMSKKELMLQEMQSLHKELIELKNRSDAMGTEE